MREVSCWCSVNKRAQSTDGEPIIEYSREKPNRERSENRKVIAFVGSRESSVKLVCCVAYEFKLHCFDCYCRVNSLRFDSGTNTERTRRVETGAYTTRFT